MKKSILPMFFRENVVLSVILINAAIIGIETVPGLSDSTLRLLKISDGVLLAFFTLEILYKINIHGKKFFHDSWRIFDFIVIAISLVPASGPFAILRTIRIIRTLRMISTVPKLKAVVTGLLKSLPGLGAVIGMLFLIFYVGSVMATNFFGGYFPEWFGSLPSSAYTLFQIMTLESWSMGIVRPVMEKFPYAWIFFLPFILITTFTTLNLFIAVIVNAMQSETEEEAKKRAEESHEERKILLHEIRELKENIQNISIVNQKIIDEIKNQKNPVLNDISGVNKKVGTEILSQQEMS